MKILPKINFFITILLLKSLSVILMFIDSWVILTVKIFDFWNLSERYNKIFSREF